MQLIIDTDEEYAPMFRAVAKAVKAKVRTNVNLDKTSQKTRKAEEKGPFIDPGTAKPGEKPSDFFKGAWKKDPTRTAKSIRESAWKRKI
ncbi:MAG: hypothetical protein LH606_11185 [Cytophagaceae bacterium]|nr:hypothetical protein [Cytophagaceae bacterium]